jgi:hypothetical protein
MGVDINWGALQTPDFASAALGGYKQGEAMRLDRAKRNALAKYSTDPDAAIAELTQAGDIQSALSLRKARQDDATLEARKRATTAYASGDTAGAQKEALGGGEIELAAAFRSMDKDQRQTAREHASDTAAYANSLKGIPYEQRKARIAEDAPDLLRRGFSNEQLASFDPSDGNIDHLVSTAMDLKDQLDRADKDRNFNLNIDKFGEEKRHNRVGESVAKANSATQAFSAQTGRMSFTERKKAGGFGTPGIGFASPDLPPDATLDN